MKIAIYFSFFLEMNKQEQPSTKKHGPYVTECKNTDNCKYCQGPHTHLVCPKPPSVQAFLTGEEDQHEGYDDEESAAIIEMEMAALMEEAQVNLAEGEEGAAEDEEDYDDEEDETIGNLMIITEELEEAESYFLSNLRIDGEYADGGGEEAMMRKNFYASRLLKIPWARRPDAFRKIVEDKMNAHRARFVLNSVNNGRIVEQFHARMGDETRY